MTPTPAPPRFAGWARKPHGRWRCLVRDCATHDEARERLHQATAGERFVDLIVMREGRTPNRKGE